ncbi:unnamed protein product [Nesidiocoris tenuis]|uniref:Uncharacterized protein n=1 Tax=Nesidiocoris tenuis TaxID=355587 RepID=A0A6H5GAI6_9HEMI|nr:unnamed protein product [Nesidiocoris tenuis]
MYSTRDFTILLSDDETVRQPDLESRAMMELSLTDVNTFGADVHEAGGVVRKKRTILKAKAAVLGVAAKAVGAGVHAVGAGVKSVALAGAKTVGKAAFKVATTVGVKVAKAAITIGIAKLLLSLVFGTRLLGGSGKGLLSSSSLSGLSSSSGGSSSNLGSLSNSSGSSGSSSGPADAGASYDGSDSSDGAAGDSGIGVIYPLETADFVNQFYGRFGPTTPRKSCESINPTKPNTMTEHDKSKILTLRTPFGSVHEGRWTADGDSGRRTRDGAPYGGRRTGDGGRGTADGSWGTGDEERGSADKDWRTRDGGQGTGDGVWRTADRGRRTLDGGHLTAGRGWWTGDGGQRTAYGGRRTRDRGWRTGDGGRGTAVGGRTDGFFLLQIRVLHPLNPELDDLPEIDPQKVSLQIPSEIVSGGFNVVNRAAPVVGEVIQRTAERLVGIGASLKPLFASSLGFGQGANYKRETGQDDDVKFGEGVDPAEEASEDSDVKADAPSQFKRSPTESEKQEEESKDEVEEEIEEEIEEEKIDDSNRQAKSAEEEKKALASSLAKQVIEKILENRAQEADSAKAPENQNFENGETSPEGDGQGEGFGCPRGRHADDVDGLGVGSRVILEAVDGGRVGGQACCVGVDEVLGRCVGGRGIPICGLATAGVLAGGQIGACCCARGAACDCLNEFINR